MASPDQLSRAAVGLGIATLALLAAVVVMSLTGSVETSGQPRSNLRLLSDTFAAGGTVDGSGEFGWSTQSQPWLSDGRVARPTEAPAVLTGFTPAATLVELNVLWADSADGAGVELAWSADESWALRLAEGRFELIRNPGLLDEAVEVDGPIPPPGGDETGTAAPGTSASLSLDGVGLSIELNGAQVAEVSSRSPMSDSSFSLTASTADVAVDRVTAKVRQ
ncbi:MAG: hypothetical protein R2704_08565 [Microthrixaceae bacterium]